MAETKSHSCNHNRRAFLRDLGRCGLCLSSAPLLANGCLLAEDPVLHLGTTDGAGQINLGPPAQIPTLAKAGTAVILDATGGPEPLLVVNAGSNNFFVLSSICTHASCTVAYDPSSGRVECPCHRSAFALDDGRVLHPPALAPLTTYGARFDKAGDLIIETRGGQNSRFGQLVNGMLTLDITAFPELSVTGDSFAFTPYGYGGPMIVTRVGPLDFVAVDGNCTYAPCLLGFDATTGEFVCPCHGCRFELGGEVAQGPATTPLTVFSTQFLLSAQQLNITVPAPARELR